MARTVWVTPTASSSTARVVSGSPSAAPENCAVTPPEGQLERTVALPILSVTNATFGGPNMDIMFVTSLMEAGIQGVAAPGDGQVGGCLLAVHGLGVSGVPKVRYQG